MQVLQDMIGDLTNSPEPMEIKLFSQDPALLKEWGPKIGDKLKKIKGVVDVKDGIENTISGSGDYDAASTRWSRRAPASRRRKSNWTPARFCRANRPRRRWS